MEQTLDCFCKGIEFTQSHRPEEAIPILTISVNQVLCLRFHERLLEVNLGFYKYSRYAVKTGQLVNYRVLELHVLMSLCIVSPR